MSLARKDDGSFIWSRDPTPGKVNVFETAVAEPAKPALASGPAQIATISQSAPKEASPTSAEEKEPTLAMVENSTPAQGAIAGASIASKKPSAKPWEIFTTIAVVILVVFLYTYYRFLKKD